MEKVWFSDTEIFPFVRNSELLALAMLIYSMRLLKDMRYDLVKVQPRRTQQSRRPTLGTPKAPPGAAIPHLQHADTVIGQDRQHMASACYRCKQGTSWQVSSCSYIAPARF